MADSDKPNVIAFVTDQLRYDHIGPSGNEVVETPNLDELAESGVTFDRNYANDPMCMPARSTLFSGKNPHKHGVRSNGVPLDTNLPTVPGLLADEGYRTHSAGKIHVHIWTLPAPQQVYHIASELSEQADSPFAERLSNVVESALRNLLEMPEDLSRSGESQTNYHDGFSNRSSNVLIHTLERLHIPKWSDTALLFRNAAEAAIPEWPVETLTDAQWEAFESELESRLETMFESVGATKYEDLAFDPTEFPEAREVWESGLISDLPEPYYGFQTTDFTGGHVNEIYGEYKDWLRENHQDAYDLLDFTHEDNTFGKSFQLLTEWSLPESKHYNHWISDRSMAFLEEAQNEDEPFFLWASYPDPHNPYAAPEPWGSMYDPDDVELPARRDGELADLPPFYEDVYNGDFFQLQGLYTDPGPEVQEEEIKEIIATSYGMVSYIDHEIGRVISRLEELGMRENTIIVFLSDHGEMMGDHWMIRKGPFQFEGLIKVPMIWNWPGQFQEGKHVETITSHLDFLPTVLDLTDTQSPHAVYEPDYRDGPDTWAGDSLRELLTTAKDPKDRSTIVETDEDNLGLFPRTLVTNRYKLTVYPEQDYGELFDLENDPDELNNRFDDEEYAEVKQRLMMELVSELVLQEGAVPSRLNVA